MANTALPYPDMASASSFGLSDQPISLSPSVANAIGSQLTEIAAIRDTSDSWGTVLAIVTFPDDAGTSRACDRQPWRDTHIRMSYEKLMSLGSKKIQQMFSPRAQARFRRRHGFEKQLPDGIEYVLDFTPPSEGPELADLIGALWLPRVVKIWFLAGHYIPGAPLEHTMGVPLRPLADKAVGAILVLGHDDVCKNKGCSLTDYQEWETKDGLPGILEEHPFPGSHIPPWRKVEDYCPIRHRVAIIRVLRAINGKDLLLNSAVRMWTVAQVAISLEVPQVVVDPVTQWLVAPPNTKFIEICPEKAFQLAYALKIPSVLIAAFRILVNELAVDYASSNPVPGRSPLTWAQRRRDDYGDYPSDPVEYASRAFAERMGGQLQVLRSDDVFNRLPIRIPEWDKLQDYRALIDSLPVIPSLPVLVSLSDADRLQAAYRDLNTALLSVFHDWIDDALALDRFSSTHHNWFSLIESQRDHYIAKPDRKPILDLYALLSPSQKILTPFFWKHLHHQAQLTRLLTNPPPNTPNHKSILDLATNFNLLLSNILPTLTLTRFDPSEFHHDLLVAIQHLYPILRDVESGIPFFLSDHLLLASLDQEKELNYLPIWADGLDDGSGGVFQDAVPATDMGPNQPGPGYHTGYTIAGTDAATTNAADTDGGFSVVDETATQRGAGDGYAESMVSISDLGVGVLSLGSNTVETSTVGRSLVVQGSGLASTVTAGTGSVVMVEEEEEGMYRDARYVVPAGHQAQGAAVERYVEEVEMEVDGGEGEDDEEEMDFDGSSDGSSTLDGFEEIDGDEVL